MTDTTLTHENYTHWLHCRHCVGRNCLEYVMRCHILKVMPNNRLKVLVFGDRYWKDTYSKKTIRYVSASKVVVKTAKTPN